MRRLVPGHIEILRNDRLLTRSQTSEFTIIIIRYLWESRWWVRTCSNVVVGRPVFDLIRWIHIFQSPKCSFTRTNRSNNRFVWTYENVFVSQLFRGIKNVYITNHFLVTFSSIKSIFFDNIIGIIPMPLPSPVFVNVTNSMKTVGRVRNCIAASFVSNLKAMVRFPSVLCTSMLQLDPGQESTHLRYTKKCHCSTDTFPLCSVDIFLDWLPISPYAYVNRLTFSVFSRHQDTKICALKKSNNFSI